MKNYRILYFQKPNLGGTITGLYDLIFGLDKSMFKPIVLFFEQNPYQEKFKNSGIKVVTLNKYLNEPNSYIKNKRDIAGNLRKYSDIFSNGYKNSKEFYNFLKNDVMLAFNILKIIKSEKIDILHNNNNLPGDRASVFAGILARIPQICHIRTLREICLIDKIFSLKVRKFIYMSKAIQNLYTKNGIPKKKGIVIYDGFNSRDYIVIDRNQINDLKRELKINENNFIITNVGRLDWWKGHEYFLKAVKDVIKTYPFTKALIVGPVPKTFDGQEYFLKIKKMVEHLKISEKVIFTGQRFDVPNIMAISDIIIHSSSEPEPFGRVIVEGMLAEKPVIATSPGGVRDIIDDRVSGFLIPPKNSNSMAEAIKYIIKNPDSSKKIAKKARRIALKRFSVSQHLFKVQDVYRNIFTE